MQFHEQNFSIILSKTFKATFNTISCVMSSQSAAVPDLSPWSTVLSGQTWSFRLWLLIRILYLGEKGGKNPMTCIPIPRDSNLIDLEVGPQVNILNTPPDEHSVKPKLVATAL